MRAMEISRSGLDVEWRRLEVISENLANANTARTADGSPYQARQLVSGPAGAFAGYLSGNGGGDPLSGVEVYGIDPIPAATRLVHEPGNPQADGDGMVAYPAIDQATQMVLMVKTSRAYQADLVAMNAAREMYGKALQLGGRS